MIRLLEYFKWRFKEKEQYKAKMKAKDEYIRFLAEQILGVLEE